MVGETKLKSIIAWTDKYSDRMMEKEMLPRFCLVAFSGAGFCLYMVIDMGVISSVRQRRR